MKLVEEKLQNTENSEFVTKKISEKISKYIEEIDISLPIPNPLNPRFFSAASPDSDSQRRKSIEREGVREPIILDENNQILSGHRRWRTCLELEITSIPYRRAIDLSKAEKAAIVLGSNLETRIIAERARRYIYKHILPSLFKKDKFTLKKISELTGIPLSTIGYYSRKEKEKNRIKYEGRDAVEIDKAKRKYNRTLKIAITCSIPVLQKLVDESEDHFHNMSNLLKRIKRDSRKHDKHTSQRKTLER